MKCIWRWKWIDDPWKGEAYGKVGQKVAKAMKEHPDDFPKMSPGIHHGRGDGFRLVEGTYEQMKNLVAIWSPVEEWRLEVYFEGEELTKAMQKWYPERV